MINMIKKKKGFTLIELIVVIAVIGILVLLAAPKFLGYTKDAKLAQIQNDVRAYEDAITANIIESEAEGINQLEVWNWNVADIDTLQDYVNEGSLVSKKEIVDNLADDTYYEVNKEDIPVKSKLNGDFIYSGSGEVYYHHDSLKGDSEGNNESEEIPEDFTLLTDDNFEFTEEESAPNKYDIDGESIRGFFYYVGNATKVVIPEEIMGNELKDHYGMFMETSVTTVISNNPEVVNVNHMFSYTQAESLDLSGFDTSNVTNMSGMFAGSESELLGLSNFDTSNVTDMSGMFVDSQSKTLDLSSFDTSNVTNMGGLFHGSQASSLDLSRIDTSNVTNMEWMFSEYEADSLDLSNFDTSSVTSMYQMFSDSKVTQLDLSKFNTENVTNMDRMFAEFQTKSLDLSSFNTSNVTDMYGMFSDSEVTILDLSSFDTSNVTRVTDMFMGSEATEGYARTQDDADKFNNSTNKPSGLTFVVKQ